MTTRSFVIAAGTAQPGTVTTVYTCPEQEITLVKSFYTRAVSGTSSDIVLFAERPGWASVVLWIGTPTVRAAQQLAADIWCVLEPGDRLDVSTGDQTVGYWISGALLPGTA